MTTTAQFKFYVDWDNDNDFGDAYEDVTAYVRDARWSIGMSKPNQLVGDEARLDLIMVNTDKRFSPEYASSPYYGEMLPQRRVKIEATLGTVTYPVYLGYIDQIQPEGLRGKTTAISAASAKEYMQEQLIELPLQENKRTDEILQEILLKLHLPPALNDTWLLGVPGYSELGVSTYMSDISGGIVLDAGLTTLDYAGDNWDKQEQNKDAVNRDWADGFRGWDAVRDIVEAERGRFFFDRQGRAQFWSRDRLLTSYTVGGTVDGSDIIDYQYSYGEDLYNDIRVTAYPRNIGTATETLWTMTDSVTVKPGKARKIHASYSERDSDARIGAKDAAISNFTYTGDNVSYTVEFNANRAVITATNTGVTDAEITAITISGKKITTYDKLEMSATDTTSRALYGTRQKRMNIKALDSAAFAQDIADYELSRLLDARGAVESIEFIIRDDAEALRVLADPMGLRIRLIDDQTEHDGEYFVIGERHERLYQRGWRVTWFLELADMNQYWILGIAGVSELGQTTYLAL